MPRIVKQIAANMPITIYDEMVFFPALQEEATEIAPGQQNNDSNLLQTQATQIAKELIDNAQAQAQEIVMQAKAEAQSMMLQLKSDFEKMSEIKMQKAMEQGYEQGLLQGETQGYLQGTQKAQQENEAFLQQKVETLKQDLERALEKVQQYKNDMGTANEKTVIDLVSAVAKKVINYKISQQDYWVIELIKNAIKDTQPCQTIKLKIGSYYIETTQRYAEELGHLFSEYTDNFSVEHPEYLDHDKCLIECDNAIIDATVELQIENVKQVIKSQM